MTRKFHYGKHQLSVGLALAIARGECQAILDRETIEKINQSKAYVDQIVTSQKIVYGINTGFGPMCTRIISPEETKRLQINILQSHSVGVGDTICPEIARLMLILKIHALAKGYSGIALATLERLIWHIENDVIPCVPSQGSLGASGDLAPLAHLFLPLIGLGQVTYQNKTYSTGSLFKKLGMPPIELGPKEGLALINGTQFIAAHAIKVVERLHNCLEHADIIAAMSLEAMKGSLKPFAQILHQIRAYQGSQHVARRFRSLLEGSEILDSHKNCNRVQDPYSLRCIPQVHGASRNAWLHLKELLHTELNSVTDNPIIIAADHTISGGNFHGQPLALPLDYATLAAAELGNISDRRIYLLLEDKFEEIPKLLVENAGLNSGFMLPQYTSAALASENKSLCFPASADSIPTSLGQEDHVSMGAVSARKTLVVVENLEKILGIELLCAAQAFDFRRPLKSSPILEACHKFVRRKIKFASQDRLFAEDMNKAINIVQNKQLTPLTDPIDLQNSNFMGEDHNGLFTLY